MGHGGRVLDERLHTTEGLRQADEAGVEAEDARGLLGVEAHGDHAAEALHLPLGHLVARVRLESRVEDGGDLVGAVEVGGDGLGVVAVALHAHGESLDAAGGEVGVEGRGDGADAALEPQELLVELGGVGHHEAADDVGVPAEVLGGGVEDVVRTQRQRLLQVRGSEGVVHDERGLPLDGGDGGDVGDGQGRVGGGLQPDELRVLPEGGLDGSDVGGVDHRVVDAPGPEGLVDEPPGAAVGVVTEDEVVTGAQQNAQDDVGGGHAGGECATVLGSLEGGDGLLQGGDGGVAAAGVLEAAAQLVEPVLREGGRRVDRGVDRAVQAVGLVSRMDGSRRETRESVSHVGHYRPSGSQFLKLPGIICRARTNAP